MATNFLVVGVIASLQCTQLQLHCVGSSVLERTHAAEEYRSLRLYNCIPTGRRYSTPSSYVATGSAPKGSLIPWRAENFFLKASVPILAVVLQFPLFFFFLFPVFFPFLRSMKRQPAWMMQTNSSTRTCSRPNKQTHVYTH